ncbi:hypothetical protein [Desulfovibrio sp. ZJ200]|uniref:hypothetical protein n=1 Tax=Desulfovibrio sp. ZJ200 TaxID=2709792 RepID=UPI0013EBD88C|nr:hypothetical protein [Desulfovibrio sp. ZJ200]
MQSNDVGMFYLDWQNKQRRATAYLSDAFMEMEQDKTIRPTFYDGTVKTMDDFLADLCRPGSLPYAIFWKGGPAGVAWLNSVEGKSARGHFVLFSRVWGRDRTRKIGRCIYENFLGYRDAQGYMFDVILGVTPKNNVLAWRGAVASGARVIGTIPHGAWLHYENRCEDAVLTAATREMLGLAGVTQ